MYTPQDDSVRIGRRNLFRGLGVAAVALGGGLVPVSAVQAAEVEGGRFTLAVPSHRFIRERAIHNHTVLQSFAFAGRTIYTVQIMQGGLRLPGEPAPVSWTQRSADGDMCLTKLDYNGNKLGHMYLKRFGHGVSIGTEPDGDDPWIWTETDSNPSSGYGRGIARFKFRNGQILHHGVDSFETHHPIPGSTGNQPSVDRLNRRVSVKHNHNGQVLYGIFDLDALVSGSYDPLYLFPRVGIEAGEWFQGSALFGDYVYQITGQPYGDDNPRSGRGNCYLSCIDIRTGDLVERFRTEAAYSLSYREPEGIAVEPGTAEGDLPRLFMGFASGSSGARKISLYYKNHPDSGSAIIVDNATAGAFTAGGSWATSTWSSQKYGDDYRYAAPEPVSDAAWFAAEIPADGNYRVDVWYPANSGYNDRAPFVVATATGNQTVHVDQRSNGGGWADIGTFALAAGEYDVVGVSRWTSGTGYIIADAVRITRV